MILFLFQWKHALPQLADLEFYVKESVEEHLDEVIITEKKHVI